MATASPWSTRPAACSTMTTCWRWRWTPCCAAVQGDVVVNLTTSSVIDDIAQAHGCRVYRTPVGEANVVEMMQAVNAVIGGEGSNGGIIFPAVHLCRDSYTRHGVPARSHGGDRLSMSQLAAGLPRYHRRIGKAHSSRACWAP